MRQFDHVSIKSKFKVENRRYALSSRDVQSFETFYHRIEAVHHLQQIEFAIFYTDTEDCLLPINNDDNLAKAIRSTEHIYLSDIHRNRSYYINNDHHYHHHNNNNYLPALVRRPYLKLFIGKKGASLEGHDNDLPNKCKKGQNFGVFSSLIASNHDQGLRPSIGTPEDFRQVSSIIDVHSVPKTCRRVRIVKHGSDKPLGFYIRDGTYKRMNEAGQVELVTGVFISRLVPGGLAESTGLLAVNDEVLEVNGVQLTGKTLDQVTDMMVANSSNLIMTITPGRMHYSSQHS